MSFVAIIISHKNCVNGNVSFPSLYFIIYDSTLGTFIILSNQVRVVAKASFPAPSSSLKTSCHYKSTSVTNSSWATKSPLMSAGRFCQLVLRELIGKHFSCKAYKLYSEPIDQTGNAETSSILQRNGTIGSK